VNRLYYGDNLDVLRNPSYFPDECVDLVYLDPPFNSNRSYNVLFKSKSGDASQAQIEAFDDTWTWSQESEHQYLDLTVRGPTAVADTLVAMRGLVGDNDVLAYLVMMAGRLVELHRVLKPTGSLYLHCDPTASHYLKLLLDAIFGPVNFRNEITWQRFGAHNDAKRFGRVTDRILFYTKSDTYTYNTVRVGYSDEHLEKRFRKSDPDGRRFWPNTCLAPGGRGPEYEWNGHTRRWRFTQENMQQLHDDGQLYYSAKGMPYRKNYLDELKGQPIQDLWTDIKMTKSGAEKLDYPTQKPVALLERIISASSNPGDLVLDPFCGCGTTVDAAERLGREWRGIDVTFLAIDLIDTRLRDIHEGIEGTYEIVGIPRDAEGAAALFARNPFDFERWAVSQVDGTPNEKQVGDRGKDGVIRFPVSNDHSNIGRALISVKGGRAVNPGMVRDLVGTVEQERGDMGVFICMTPPTSGMLDVARRSGDYVWPVDGRRFPKIQILTIAELLDGKRPAMPTPFLPYLQAQRLVNDDQLSLL
jgi:DNA modification methylase